MKDTKPAPRSKPKLPIIVSNPGKIFWPDEGYTKLDLIEFYAAIFSSFEPYVKNRMLTLERCPDGMKGQCFYQREIPDGVPPGTPTKRIQNVTGKRKFTNYVVGGSLKTQLALVNLGSIAIHVMGSRASSPRQPDWVCFDLDPDSGEFAEAAKAGQYVKEELDALKLKSFAKTSGSRGIHVFVPIRTGPDATEVLSFAQVVVQKVAAARPKELTVEHSIRARRGRVYLDPFRNGFGQTVVAPYSVRRREKAPVSTPLDWSGQAHPDSFGIQRREFCKAAQTLRSLEGFFRSRQSLKDAARLLHKL